MLENIGATQAINDLLFQSHGGRMRFFPVWNAAALGAASFATLRAYGAFVVRKYQHPGAIHKCALGSTSALCAWPPACRDGIVSLRSS